MHQILAKFSRFLLNRSRLWPTRRCDQQLLDGVEAYRPGHEISELHERFTALDPNEAFVGHARNVVEIFHVTSKRMALRHHRLPGGIGNRVLQLSGQKSRVVITHTIGRRESTTGLTELLRFKYEFARLEFECPRVMGRPGALCQLFSF